jgi:ribosomal protein S18 acetylase RimI-like enzyme
MYFMIVRKAVYADVKSIVTYLFLAMEDIVYGFIGEADSAKGLALMLHFVADENNQYSYQNFWVAEDDGIVFGALNVYDGARLHELRQPVINYIRSRFVGGFSPEDETQAGEYYIDTLGVDPRRQGQGIGTLLLQFVIDEFVTKRSKTLGLLVDETNSAAKRLYIKLGFKSIGTRVLFGKKMEHLQILP